MSAEMKDGPRRSRVRIVKDDSRVISSRLEQS